MKTLCARCPFRAHYDRKPRSLLGKLWRWHINWCPGWMIYMKSLPDDERETVKQQYSLK